jgi:hypothetical protein
MEANLVHHEFIVGSYLEDDAANEEYASRCLSNIILDMEIGNPVILYNIDQVYSSLYALFNQKLFVAFRQKVL